MKPKDIFVLFFIIPLGLSFLVISALLYFNKGRSRELINAKLKLGALLLTFSWFSACNKADHKGDGNFSVTCYYMVIPNSVEFIDKVEFSDSDDSIKYKVNDTIRLKVNDPTYQLYLYRIKSQNNVNRIAFFKVKEFNNNSDSDSVLNILVDNSFKHGKYNFEIFGINGGFDYKEIYNDTIYIK